MKTLHTKILLSRRVNKHMLITWETHRTNAFAVYGFEKQVKFSNRGYLVLEMVNDMPMRAMGFLGFN
jgi:hypothetical protein